MRVGLMAVVDWSIAGHVTGCGNRKGPCLVTDELDRLGQFDRQIQFGNTAT
jgi:hypothetical protein